MPKHSIHLKISPPLWSWVVAQAEARGCSYIAVIEQAITEAKARQEMAGERRKTAA